MRHNGKGLDEYLKVIQMSLVDSDIYKIYGLRAGVHCAVTCTSK